MNIINFFKRFASAFSIIFSCVSLIGLAMYYIYRLSYGLTLCAYGMALSSVFQVIRLWGQDRGRAMIMLMTTIMLLAFIIFYL